MEQLRLLDLSAGTGETEPDDRPWQLDERTRAVGRQGLQAARRALTQPSSGRAA